MALNKFYNKRKSSKSKQLRNFTYYKTCLSEALYDISLKMNLRIDRLIFYNTRKRPCSNAFTSLDLHSFLNMQILSVSIVMIILGFEKQVAKKQVDGAGCN